MIRIPVVVRPTFPGLISMIKIRRPICQTSIAAFLAALIASPIVADAQLQWDPGQTPATPSGGTGVWNTTSNFWSDGAANTTWDSLNAIFGGTAGTVTIDNAAAGVSATGLTFNTTGYIINAQTGTDTLTLTGATPTITVNGLAGDTATINAIIAGSSGLTMAGTGTLVLGGVNTFSGGVNINAGTLSVGTTTRLGDNANVITIDGGKLFASAGFTNARTVQLNNNAANSIGVAASSTLTQSGVVQGTGGFTKADGGTLTLGSGAADTAANTFSGTTTLAAGTLTLNKADGTDALAGNLDITGGGLTLSRSNQMGAGVNLTISSGTIAWGNFSDTFASLTATGGTLNSGNTNGGIITLTGALNLGAGTTFGINSGGQWTADSATFGTSTFSLGGNNATRVTRIATGPGGLTLIGQTIGLNSVANAGSSLGSAIVLGGNVTSNGTSAINVTNGYASRDVDLNGASRTFDVQSGRLTLQARVVGTGDINVSGAGALALSNNAAAGASTFTGNINVPSGATLRLDGALGVATAGDVTYNGTLGNVANQVNLNGGTLQGATADRTLYGRVINIGAGGGTLDATGTSYIDFVEAGQQQLRFNNGAQATGGATPVVTSILVGTTPLMKTGPGRISFQSASPNFSGPVTITNGTLEGSGVTLGDASATNTVTVTGGNWAISGGAAQNITLGGGAVSANGGNQALSGTVGLTSATSSYVFLNNFWTDAAAGHTITLSNVVSGSGDLTVAVNRAGYDNNSGTLLLQNTGNTLSGNVTVGKNLNLTNSATGGTGSALGTATITLAQGKLNLRDNGAGSGALLPGYGNNVVVTPAANITARGDLAGTATITADRASGTNTGNTFQLGTLSIGAQQLDVTGLNSYGVRFNGLTTLTGNAIFNVTASTLTLGGGISGAGHTFTKSGAGTMRVLGSNDAGFTLSGGTLEFDTAPGGAGRTIAIAAGTAFAAGYAATQANFLDRITLDSAGVAALGVDSTFNPDFTGFTAGLRLGASANVSLTGTITPADGTVRLGGGAAGVTLTIASSNAIGGTSSLDLNTNGTNANTVFLADSNNYSGATTVGGGMTLRAASNAALGTGTGITLDNGTLQLATGGSFAGFSSRTLTINAGGGTLDLGDSDIALTSLAGTGALTKLGSGRLTLSGASTITGLNVAAGPVRATTNAGALGAGTLTLSGGSLELANDTALAFGRNTTVTTNTTITSDVLTAGGAGVTHTLGTVALNNGSTLTVTPGANVGSGTAGVTFGATTIGTGTATLLTNAGAQTNFAATTLTGNLIVDGAGNATFTGNTGGAGTLTKNGAGTLTIQADPNHTGATTVNAGTLTLANTGSIDSNITVNSGGTLLSTGTINDANTVTVNTSGTWDLRVNDTIARLMGGGLVTKGTAGLATLTLNSGVAATFDGVIQDGTGQLSLTKSGANTVTLTGTNAYTGNTNINTGSITATGRLSGGTAATIVTVGDNNGNDESLTLGANDTIAGTLDRFADAATLRLNGTVAVNYIGAAPGGATAEMAGPLDFAAGSGSFSVAPAAGGEAQVTFASLNRLNNNATGVIRGTGLGLAAGTGDRSRVLFNAAPATLGLGGSGSSASIIPFLIGGTHATEAPNTFLRYDATNGVVPLAGTDYAGTVAGSTGLNVSVGATETVTTDAAINALRITGGTTTLSGAAADVRVTSGALLFSADGTIDGTGTITLSDGLANLTGAGRQAIINVAGNSAVTGTISASLGVPSGLIIGDAGAGANVLLLTGDNKITGGIVLNNGILRLGSAGALNDDYFNDLILRGGNSTTTDATSTGLQLHGQNASVLFAGNDRLHASARIENGLAATTSTLTIVTNAISDDNAGILQNGAGILALTKRGASELILEQTNTFTGATEVMQGVLRLRDNAAARLTGTTAVNIRGGSVLYIHNQNDQQQNDRINNAAPFNMHGGSFQYDQNQSDFSTNPTETLGALNILNGNNTITTDFANSADTQNLIFNLLTQSPGAALNFQGFNTSGDVAIGEGTNRNRITFTSAPINTAGGILGGAIYHTKDFNNAATQDVVHFATYSPDVDAGAGVSPSVAVFAGYNTGLESTWTTTTVANPAADVVLSANRTIEALRLGGGIDVDIGAGRTLNLATGGLIQNGASSTISNGTLTAGDAAAGELAIRVEDNLTASILTISSAIADNTGGAVSLLKTGADTLVLGGANTYTGRTTLQGGQVNITADNNLGAAPTTATAGHLRLYGVTLAQTAATGTITLSPNRGLELGGAANAISTAAGSNLVFNTPGITSNGVSSLTLTGHVDMAIGGDSAIGGAFTITGTTTIGQTEVSLGGTTNSIGESLSVGVNTGNASLSYGVAGGTLTVGLGNPNASNLDVGTRPAGGPSGTSANFPNVGVLNLAGSASFIASVDRVRVGVLITDPSTDQNTRGTITLPTNSTITAGTEVVVSDSNADALAGHPSLTRLGPARTRSRRRCSPSGSAKRTAPWPSRRAAR